jgi:BirA family biotin operon repressor/biotin-[acetyl-CoA-carboxylase] ligase
MADAFVDADQLRAATFVRHVEIHDSLDSTNNLAIQLARATDIELPALIVARHQTAGRGRDKNQWWSADGALTFSVMLEPGAHGISTANWPQLSLATAVAVCDALELRIADCGLWIDENNPQSEMRIPKSIPPLGIKWPNDVMLDGRKISGILIESPGGAVPAKNRLIIGIGINVNNSLRFKSQDATLRAIALCDYTGGSHDLSAVLIGVLDAIACRLAQLRAGDSALSHAWQQLNLLAGQSVIFENDGRQTSGRCMEIARDGAIVIDTPLGVQRFHSGSIRPLG